MESLLEVLSRLVLGNKILESGNLENRIRELGDESSQQIADAYYEKNEKPEIIFEVGVELGRKADDDTIYRIEVEDSRYFFIGTEADIIRKIEEKEEEKIGGDADILKDVDGIEI